MCFRARVILSFVTLVWLIVPLAAEAQQQEQKIPRIGVFAPTVPTTGGHLVDAFRQGLRDLGYVSLKTAKAIGLTIPPSLRLRADEVAV